MRFWIRVPLGWIAFVGLLLAIDALAPTPHGLAAVVATAGAQLLVFMAAGGAIALALDRSLVRESMALFKASG